MISLITYTTSNLNSYQQEIAGMNNGSYKQWIMSFLDIKNSYITCVYRFVLILTADTNPRVPMS